MAWEPRLSADVGRTPEPTDEELRLLREELDPEGVHTR
jgi:glutaconate CoA-transferase, subunit B